MKNFPFEDAARLIELAINEDCGEAGDLSSTLSLPEDHQSEAVIIAKQEGVLSGLQVIPMVFKYLDADVSIELFKADGDRVLEGDEVAIISGPSIPILTAERTILNFLQQLSGVASVTQKYVDRCEGTECRILDTRKTTPAYRTLQKYAVRCGGGVNHRMGLYDMIMLKDNHIQACGGVNAAVEKILATRPEGVPIEVEVETLDQLENMLQYPVERIMLDNMDTMTMRLAVQQVRATDHKAELEASGNMTLDRIAEVAGTGVDFISVGALTHSTPALDLSMRFR